MQSILISFNSRNSVLTFARMLKNFNIRSTTVNTPRAISISCGLCVRTEYAYLKNVINIIRQSNLTGFNGVYLYSRTNTHEHVERIY